MHPQIRENISLKPYNTFGIEATAKYFAPFSSAEELVQLVEDAGGTGTQKLLVLGGGSNVLLTHDFDGLVLLNRVEGISVVNEDEEEVYMKVGAGVNWHAFVCYCLDRNLAGVENLALIPGSTGASPMQNIGAYGVEIKDVFHELLAYHIASRAWHTFTKEDCGFGYRESVFKKKYKGQYVITSVTFRLQKQAAYHLDYGAIRQELERMKVAELSIRAIAEAVINIRQSKLPDPKVLGNAGSFFKNPVVPDGVYQALREKHPLLVGFPGDGGTKLAAGWLIEACGWKGFRRGDAGCFEKQALVLVNHGAASGSEIFALSSEIIASVKDQFGVELEREVNII